MVSSVDGPSTQPVIFNYYQADINIAHISLLARFLPLYRAGLVVFIDYEMAISHRKRSPLLILQ